MVRGVVDLSKHFQKVHPQNSFLDEKWWFLDVPQLGKYSEYENNKGMKNILKFSNFSKIFQERAWDTLNIPTPATENSG